MALFPNSQVNGYTFGGKTHTNLVVSEGNAPAEEWIVSKEENSKVKFVYPFGPEGNQEVVLAKGKIVEAAPAEYDTEHGRYRTALKQATEGSRKAIGVIQNNQYKRYRDRFTGMQPTVLTRNYIEVPLFEHEVIDTASQFASAMKYGAAYSAKGDALQPGDFVKVGKDGNFVKLDASKPEASPFEIIGQVLAAERELPPAGFLQYYMDMEIPELEAYLKGLSTTPSPGFNPDGSAAAYPFGAPHQLHGWKNDFEKLLNPTINKGIPFLTDGYFAAKQRVADIKLDDIFDKTTNNDGHIEHIHATDGVTIAGKTVATKADVRNLAVFIKLRHKFDKAELNSIVVKLGGKALASEDVHVDIKNNTVVAYLEPGLAAAELTIDADLVVDPIAGVPTEWDYAGSVGAVRILLQR